MGYKKYPLLRYEVMNGITLCYACHKKFHDEFGKSNFPNIARIYNLKNKEKYIGWGKKNGTKIDISDFKWRDE